MEIDQLETPANPTPKTQWNVDKILSISAIVISFAACLLLAYQTTLIREQQLLSVLPHLSIGNKGSFTPNYRIALNNYGIGPAFIQEIRITYKGEIQDGQDLTSFILEHAEILQNDASLYHSNLVPGMLIPAGTELALLEVNNSLETADRLYNIMEKLYQEGLKFEIIYASVYEEKWKITENSITPEKL